jgi:hypothetical protein
MSTTLEIVTVIVSSIAIGASVVSVLLFVLLASLQKKLIIRAGEQSKVTEETALTLQLFTESLKDEVPDDNREVLRSLVERYSETSLTGVLDDQVERGYVFEALANPAKLPWESELQRGGRSKEGERGERSKEVDRGERSKEVDRGERSR